MNKWLKLMEAVGGEGGAAAAAAAEGATGGATAGVATVAFDWNTHIKDPETKEAFGKMFPGMKTPEDLAKTAVHQQRKIGQQGVPLPQKPEEFVPFMQTHFKVPKDGKGYNFDKLNVPKGLDVDKVALQGFAENFAKAGMRQEQVESVLGSYYEMAAQQQQQQVAKRGQEATESKLALQKEWGTNFDANMKVAEMALGNLGGDALKKSIVDSGLHNNAEFVKFLTQIGGLMKEDPISGKMSGGGFSAGPEQAKQEIDQLYGDEKFRQAYYNTNHPGHAAAQARMRTLMEIKHGERGRK